MARHVLLDALANAKGLPILAIGGCLLSMDEMAPELLAIIESAANGTLARPDDENLLFFALHILGGGRVERLHAPLMRLLHRPSEELDKLLGDAVHETLGKIIAGGFNGNANDLFDLLRDPSIDEYVRNTVFGAVAFLTWAGRIDTSATRECLQRFDEERPIPGGDYAWFAWSRAIEMLGWDDMAERVEQAYRDGRIDDTLSNIKSFRRGLAEEMQALPGDDSRFQKEGQGYINDVAEALQVFSFGRDAEPPPVARPPAPLGIPKKADRWRHVGRNDPCPCGSGKKYKRCCLAA